MLEGNPMSDTWKSMITEQARRRMASKPARQQRREALEFYEREKARKRPDPDDADDASYRRERFM